MDRRSPNTTPRRGPRVLALLAGGAAAALVAGLAFAQTYSLVPFAGSVPAAAVEAGQAKDRSPLFVCVAESWGGEHPGCLGDDGLCQVPWGGQAHRFDAGFSVLVTAGAATGRWQRMGSGGVPKNAFVAGDDGGDIYVCRVAVAGGLYPGKLTDDGWCYVAVDDKELTFSNDYEVLVD